MWPAPLEHQVCRDTGGTTRSPGSFDSLGGVGRVVTWDENQMTKLPQPLTSSSYPKPPPTAYPWNPYLPASLLLCAPDAQIENMSGASSLHPSSLVLVLLQLLKRSNSTCLEFDPKFQVLFILFLHFLCCG